MAQKHGWRGHCVMCAFQSGKVRGTRRDTDPVPTRRLVGRARRTKRREIPADQLA